MSKRNDGAEKVLAELNRLDAMIDWSVLCAIDDEEVLTCGKINALIFALESFGYSVHFDKARGAWALK